MDSSCKHEIGMRLRAKREKAGYTRERLGELCSLSPRFLANVELGDSTFSLDSLMAVCRILSCSSDEILFGTSSSDENWQDTITQIQHLDIAYKDEVNKLIRTLIETIRKAEQR